LSHNGHTEFAMADAFLQEKFKLAKFFPSITIRIMGAWANDPFGNDMACDWIYAAEKTTGLSFIQKTLETVTDTGESYLEAPTAEQAIAACDTIARLKGKFYVQNAYTKSLDSWVARQQVTISDELVEKASKVIDRILSEPSELLELWQESGEFEDWKEQMTDLKERLS
jgi:hypothetical protein